MGLSTKFIMVQKMLFKANAGKTREWAIQIHAAQLIFVCVCVQVSLKVLTRYLYQQVFVSAPKKIR